MSDLTRHDQWWSPIKRWIRRAVVWFGGQEPVALITLMIVVASTWVFVEIAAEVTSGDTQAFDRWVVRSLRTAEDASVPIGPPWFQEIGRDATALGGIAALTMISCIVAGYLWLTDRLRMMVLLLVSTFGGLALSLLMKQLIARPRPDFVPHLSHVYTSSFPSGHSMLSAVVFLTLGSLLTTITTDRKVKAYFLGVAVLLAIIVGVSRIYLGVHYPTDVMAGWLAGLVWALLCWLVAHYLQVRRHVEPPEAE
jgi:undecaprenyl-diphosphatase